MPLLNYEATDQHSGYPKTCWTEFTKPQ